MSAEEDRKKRGVHQRKHRSSHRDHKSHRRKRIRPLVSLVKQFWFELVALGLFGLGVFLLVERLRIKAVIRRALVNWAKMFGATAGSLWDRVVAVFNSAEKSDVVGVILVVVALVMIALSIRWRAIQRHASLPLQKECPECRQDLHRMPRRFSDRLLEFFLWIRIRRYSCSKCSFRASVWKTRGEHE